VVTRFYALGQRFKFSSHVAALYFTLYGNAFPGVVLDGCWVECPYTVHVVKFGCRYFYKISEFNLSHGRETDPTTSA